MHRDVITHLVATKTDFVITASIDGHIKFWKKMEEGIEFVKHFRSHLCNLIINFYNFYNENLFLFIYAFAVPITSLSVNAGGTLLCSSSSDKCAKVFDVVNFDMINIIKLGFVPGCSCWIHSPGDAVQSLAM